MFIPKWVLAILFLVSVGSTVGLLFVLTQRSTSQIDGQPSASTTVIVQPSASPNTTDLQASAAASPLSATAEWKKHKQDSLSIALEYPSNWYVAATSSAVLRISNFEGESFPEGDTLQNIQMHITRTKKASSSSKLESFLELRLNNLKKEYSNASVSKESKRSIDDYDAVDRTYSVGGEETVLLREITFATRSYFYTITISPHDSALGPIADEVFKTIDII